MRLRPFTLALTLAVLPLGLGACGSATEEEFCDMYNAIYALDQDLESYGVERVSEEDGLKELYGSVPDSAPDDVKDAAEYLADNHTGTADLREGVDSGELSDAEQDRIFGEMGTFGSYSQATCQS